MARISVQPESLRDRSAQIQSYAGELAALASRLRRTISSLDWEGYQPANLEGAWGQAQALAERLLNQADRLADFLMRKAGEFEEVDRTCAQEVGEMNTTWGALQQAWSGQWQQVQPVITYPQSLVQGIRTLGAPAPGLAKAVSITGATRLVCGRYAGHRDLRSSVAPEWRERLERAANDTPGGNPWNE